MQKYTKMLLSEESVIQFIFEKFAGSIKYGQLKLDLRSIELLISQAQDALISIAFDVKRAKNE